AAQRAVARVVQAVAAALHAEQAAGPQRLADVADDAGDEGGAALALADRIHGQVVDHRVQAARFGNPVEGVADDHPGMPAVEGVAADPRQVLAAKLHDLLVDLDHVQLARQLAERLQAAQQLLQHAAVAAAEDGYPL